MVPGKCIKVIVLYEEAFWLTTEKGRVNQGSKTLDQLFPMHNVFHAQVGQYPALVGLITAQAAVKYSSLSAQERRLSVLFQMHELFCPICQLATVTHSTSTCMPPPSPSSSPALFTCLAYRPVQFVEKDWTVETYSDGCFASLFRPNTFVRSGPHLKTHLYYPSPPPTAVDTIDIDIASPEISLGTDIGASAIARGIQECEWIEELSDALVGSPSPLEPAVYWCSTETAPRYTGYIEGAMLAGEQAAEDILRGL
jgi:hypothetical protein